MLIKMLPERIFSLHILTAVLSEKEDLCMFADVIFSVMNSDNLKL